MVFSVTRLMTGGIIPRGQGAGGGIATGIARVRPRKVQDRRGVFMKMIGLIITVLVLMAACASTQDSNRSGPSDPSVAYGGTFQTRIRSGGSI